jgi:uncharacterized iron-regulated membrane protein
VYSVMAAVLVAVLAGTVLAFLWLRHRVLHPETLARQSPVQQAVTAEVLDAAPAAIPAQPGALAIEPPRETHTHFHFPTADAAAAAVRAMQELGR